MKLILEIDTDSLADLDKAQKYLDFARAQLSPPASKLKATVQEWIKATAAEIHKWLLNHAKEPVRLSTAYYKVTNQSITDMTDARRRTLLRELAACIRRHSSSAPEGATVVFLDAAGNYDTELK